METPIKRFKKQTVEIEWNWREENDDRSFSLGVGIRTK